MVCWRGIGLMVGVGLGTYEDGAVTGVALSLWADSMICWVALCTELADEELVSETSGLMVRAEEFDIDLEGKCPSDVAFQPGGSCRMGSTGLARRVYAGPDALELAESVGLVRTVYVGLGAFEDACPDCPTRLEVR